MLWLQPGEWQEIEDETQFAKLLLSLANWGAVPEPLKGQLLLLCWVQIPSPRDMPLPGTSEGAQRFAACLLLPAWVLVCCMHRLCASRALLRAWCSGDAPPPASAATGRAAFRPCPKFSWLRGVNSQRGGAAAFSHISPHHLWKSAMLCSQLSLPLAKL